MAKAKTAEGEIETKERDYDEVTYVPGPQDPPLTRFNGINFRANVMVKVPKTSTVQVPIVKQHEQPDGTITSKAYESRLRVAVILADNPCFAINGKKPRPRKVETARVPVNAAQYRNYATHWIAEADDAAAMDARWEAEEHLRGLCAVHDSDVSTIRMFFDAKHDQCEGTGSIHIPAMPAI